MAKRTNKERGCCSRGHAMNFATGENVMQTKGQPARCRACWEIAADEAHDRRDRLVRAKRVMGLNPPAGAPEQDESFGVTAKDIADLS
jgi:hypothetical protein